MGNIYLKEIDNFIEKTDTEDEYLTNLAGLIIPFLNIEKDNIDFEYLLEEKLPDDKKRFIAFCLLRVLNKKTNLITNNNKIKFKIYKLFETTIPEVYQSCINIKGANGKKLKKQQTHDIEPRLITYVTDFEKKVKNKIGTEIVLSNIEIFQRHYRQAFSDRNQKRFLSSFTEDNPEEQILDNLFKTIKDYHGAKSKLDFYNKAIELLDKIIDKSNKIGTKYSLEFISKPFLKIQKLLEKDFKNDPLSKPAQLSIAKTEKKYPFIKDIKKHKIQLLISNTSEGYANDTIVKIKSYSKDIIKIEQIEQFIGNIKTSSIIEFEYDCIKNADKIFMHIIVEWKNFNRLLAKLKNAKITV